jgi:predicted anti-sigma-YlaC factor YlaD
MNCEFCHKNLEEYLAGSLPQDMRILVEDHLNKCKGCAEIFSLANLAEKVIRKEKQQEPNPFLSTRIMTAIDTAGTTVPHSSPVFIRAIKSFAILVSLAAVIYTGIIVGNLSKSASNSNALPMELVLINDADIEAVSLLSTE